ncbi:uncharacterized protein LOC120631476 [Pararge aegeria]|uniref:Jg15331 protein n=1 Tax=Pararge aegeria aegeria TaxID=348720 RepID=A0A8S4RKR3_9NEOP|nr:uncharacterized protein LOC120631476 [Pararge aegeria]CAH2236572.1 jg15331 [Pararge aegeria aegeria]
MRCEIPVLLRCCFCFPLRHGLLVWAYIKQILSVLFVAYMISNARSNFSRMSGGSYAMFAISLTLTVVDIVFHVLFIISAHTKDYKKMRIFYRYSIVIVGLDSGLMILLFIALSIYYLYLSPVILIILLSITWPTLVLSLIIAILQVYLIILVRSEFVKLKNNSQFEFVNNAAEEKCSANIDFVKEIPAAV